MSVDCLIRPLLGNLTPQQIQELIDAPLHEGLMSPSFALTSYLTPPVIEGISVDILRMSDGNKPGQEGIIMVNIPYELTLPGSSLSFRLPQVIAEEIDDNNYPVTMTLADGSPLPAWLQYNPDSNTFTAINIPEGYLPITVMINYGGQSWKLEIKEQG